MPSRRKDISIKEDLIEEVAVYMVMTKFLQRFPVFEDVTSGSLTDRQYKTRTVKLLKVLGLIKLSLIH